jgi:erythromycin esterase-like protein
MKHSGSNSGGSVSTTRKDLDPFSSHQHPPGMWAAGQESASAMSTGYKRSVNQTATSDEVRAQAALHGYGSNNDSAYRTYQSQENTMTNRSAASYTRAPSHVGEKMDGDCLEEALDDIYDRRILFLGRFELYSQVCFYEHVFMVPFTSVLLLVVRC